MRRLLTRSIPILSVLVLTNCSGGDGAGRGVTSLEPLRDAAEMTVSFGGEELGEDFMLVEPSLLDGLAVSPGGEVLVVDEDYVKVYTLAGEPRTRIGGPGDGPGEFRRVRSLYMSPDGYFTVFGGDFGFTAHFFRPDRSYISRTDLRNEPSIQSFLTERGLRVDRPDGVYCMSDDEQLIVLQAEDEDRTNAYHREVFLVLRKGDDLEVLAQYDQTNGVGGPDRPFLYMDALGKLMAVPLPGRRVAYMHGFHDSIREAAEPTYTINILDLDSGERSQVTNRWVPSELLWESPDYPEDYKQSRPEQYKAQMERFRVAGEEIAKRKWAVPVVTLAADGPYLFAFRPTFNDSMEVVADVFDTDRGTFLGAVVLPKAYGIALGEGHACTLNNYNYTGDAPLVNVFRLAPRVYGGD